MTVREAMHLAARIPYWPAAYASLLAYLNIDRANPSYYSETIRHELERDNDTILMREWETMSPGERLHVAACVIAEEVSGIAEAGPFEAFDEAMRDGEVAGALRCAGPPDKDAPDPQVSCLRMADERPVRPKALVRCSRGAMVFSAATSLSAIALAFDVPHARLALGVSAGLMVVFFFAGLVLANEAD